jgi:diacylglycerol kinase
MIALHSVPQPPGMDEAPPRPRSRRPWRDKLRAALRGVKLGVRGHSSFFVHFFFTALALAAAIVLHCDLVQWCLLLGCVGLVLTAELFNSALVVLVRGLGEEERARVGPCLHVAAGAVLLASATASAVGGLILLSRLLDLCAPLFEARQ